MLLFIAFPLVSVVLQSVHTAHEAVLVTVENCGPFGCKKKLRLIRMQQAQFVQLSLLADLLGWIFILTVAIWQLLKSNKHGHQLIAYPLFFKLLAIYHFTGQWHLPLPLPLQ